MEVWTSEGAQEGILGPQSGGPQTAVEMQAPLEPARPDDDQHVVVSHEAPTTVIQYKLEQGFIRLVIWQHISDSKTLSSMKKVSRQKWPYNIVQ